MATRASGRHRQRGFSLLELLLVLVIVGLIISLAGVSVSSGSRPYLIDASLNNFADIAEYALDEAQMSGIDMGLFIEQYGDKGSDRYSYQWMQRDFGGWAMARFDADAYGRKPMPEGVDVLLEVEQGNALVQERDAVDDRDRADQPQVIFFSSGETTPGIMTWVDQDSGEVLWELEWDLLGRMELRRRGEARDDED